MKLLSGLMLIIDTSADGELAPPGKLQWECTYAYTATYCVYTRIAWSLAFSLRFTDSTGVRLAP